MKSAILLVIALLALAGCVSAAHHQKTVDDLSKTCKKAYDATIKDFEGVSKGECGLISDVIGYCESNNATVVNEALDTYCQEDGKCYKLFEKHIAKLEEDCEDELNYEDADTANFWLIDWYYTKVVNWADHICDTSSEDNYCLAEAYEFGKMYDGFADNATVNAEFCARESSCYEDQVEAQYESLSFLIDYPKSDVGKAVNVYLNYIDDLLCKDGCLAEFIELTTQWQEWQADGFADIQADNKKLKDSDVDDFYTWYEEKLCGSCRAYIIDLMNEIAAIEGDNPEFTFSGCGSDGRGSYCDLRDAQTSIKFGAGAIACPTDNSECADAQADPAVYGKDRDACDLVFFTDAEGKSPKCSKECKKTAEPIEAYLGCCLSDSWRSKFVPDDLDDLVDPTMSIHNTYEKAADYWADCGGVNFDPEDYCVARVSSSFTVEVHGIDISSATEKELDALTLDIQKDIAIFLLGSEKYVNDVEIMVSSDDDEHIEIEIVVQHDDSVTTFAAAKMEVIDEDNLTNTADNKLADKKGIEVEGVTTSFSGVFSVVPTVFALLCAVVALLF